MHVDVNCVDGDIISLKKNTAPISELVLRGSRPLDQGRAFEFCAGEHFFVNGCSSSINYLHGNSIKIKPKAN